jgi:hypothetical protein
MAAKVRSTPPIPGLLAQFPRGDLTCGLTRLKERTAFGSAAQVDLVDDHAPDLASAVCNELARHIASNFSVMATHRSASRTFSMSRLYSPDSRSNRSSLPGHAPSSSVSNRCGAGHAAFSAPPRGSCAAPRACRPRSYPRRSVTIKLSFGRGRGGHVWALDDPTYIAGHPNNQPTDSANVALISINATASLLAQHTSLNVAPAGWANRAHPVRAAHQGLWGEDRSVLPWGAFPG